jgi:hypothetical protein
MQKLMARAQHKKAMDERRAGLDVSLDNQLDSLMDVQKAGSEPSHSGLKMADVPSYRPDTYGYTPLDATAVQDPLSVNNSPFMDLNDETMGMDLGPLDNEMDWTGWNSLVREFRLDTDSGDPDLGVALGGNITWW